MLHFERSFIMLCDTHTEGECLDRSLFGDKAKRLRFLNEIVSGDLGFLLNTETDELLGIFRASSAPQLHIVRDAWNGRFPAQIRVDLVNELQRINDATYILTKAGVGMTQLKSGFPAPQYPVHGRDVGEKILAHFEKPVE